MTPRRTVAFAAAALVAPLAFTAPAHAGPGEFCVWNQSRYEGHLACVRADERYRDLPGDFGGTVRSFANETDGTACLIHWANGVRVNVILPRPGERIENGTYGPVDAIGTYC